MPDRKFYFIATLTGLLLAGFLATSLISYSVARDSLSRQISDQMLPLTSDNLYSEIQQDLLRPIVISSAMAGNTFVRDWLAEEGRNPQRISQYLDSVQQRFGTITAFLVSEQTHQYYHSTGVLKTLDPSYPGDAWYFRVRESHEPYEINIDDDTADRNRLSIFVNFRILDDRGRYLGVTGVGLSMDSVAALFESYQRRYNSRIYFIDRQGEVTLHGPGLDVTANLHERAGLQPHAMEILTSPGANLSYRNADGETVYLNSRLVPELDWFLVVEQESARDEARILNTLIVNLLISLAVSLVVLLIAWATLGKYQRRLLEMATTDRLTGATSRQAFENLFDYAVRGARRRRQKLSVLLVDLDHFKTINDRFGHLGGDRVLGAVASRLRSLCRDSDILCRWGGEEFLILMEDCGLEGAKQRAHALRQAIASKPIRFGREDIDITLSVGVAEHLDGETLESLVSRADGALYVAKHNGRDRVELAS